jgi:predicted nucleic acid-binding protein
VIILDTNVLSELMKATPDSGVQRWFGLLRGEPLATTAITVAEIIYGLSRLPKGRRATSLIEGFESLIERLPVLVLNEDAARHAGAFRAARARAGASVASEDMFIAGIAASAGAAVATRNLRDFTGLPVEVVDPWSA